MTTPDRYNVTENRDGMGFFNGIEPAINGSFVNYSDYEKLLAANMALVAGQAKMQEDNAKLHAVINGACVWTDGEPPKLYGSEWFIAKSIHGERCVLKALDEGNSYDYQTADETYIKAKNVKSWMQFPDSNFIPFADHIAALSPRGQDHAG